MFGLVAMFRSDEFLRCDPPVDHQGNTTARDELGYGCTKVGTTHRCQHYHFRARNPAFRAPSRFSVKMYRFFACFALIMQCIYSYYFVFYLFEIE